MTAVVAELLDGGIENPVDVVDVENSPSAVQRLGVRPTVARRPTKIRNENVVTPVDPVGKPRHERDLPLICRAAVDPAQQSSSRCDAAVQTGMEFHILRSVGHHAHEFGFDKCLRLRPRVRGSDFDHRSLPFTSTRVVHDDLRRGLATRAHSSKRVATPGQLAMNGFGPFDDCPRVQIDGTQTTEAALVAHEGRVFAGGVEAPTALSLTPCRPTVFEGFSHSAPALDREIEPTVRIVEPPEATSITGHLGLLVLDLPVADERSILGDETTFVPGHVRRRPCLPDESIAPPHRIEDEREVATVDTPVPPSRHVEFVHLRLIHDIRNTRPIEMGDRGRQHSSVAVLDHESICPDQVPQRQIADGRDGEDLHPPGNPVEAPSPETSAGSHEPRRDRFDARRHKRAHNHPRAVRIASDVGNGPTVVGDSRFGKLVPG